MILISLLSLVVIGYTGIYFFQTSRVISFIINAERIHNINYHIGLENFYQYLTTGDTSLIETGLAKLDSANYLAMTFGKTNESLQKMSDKEYIDFLYYAVEEAFDFKKANARLMTNRLKLLIALNNKHVFNSFKIAETGYEKGEYIRQLIIEYLNKPGQEELDKIVAANAEMNDFFRQFATVIYKLSEFARRFLIICIIMTLLFVGVLMVLISNIISKSITVPIFNLLENTRKLSKGDLDVSFDQTSEDEIGKLNHEVNEMVENLKRITEQARIISQGDYTTQMTPRSDRDVLGIAIQDMTRSLDDLSKKTAKENWLKSGLNDLNDELRGDPDIQTLTQKVITRLCKTLNAQMGVFYVRQPETDELHQTASYAFTNRKSLSNIVKIGEGLVGQAALEKQPISLTSMPGDYFRIESGLGNSLPQYVIVMPVVFEDELTGVIELAFLEKPGDDKIEFLNQAVENTGIVIKSAYTRTEMQKLLIKTQEQAEELMTQQEELRQSNEELEEQTRALKDSEQELQQQQEELRVTNEELEERSKMLQEQRDDIKRKNENLKKAQEEIEAKARDLELSSRYKSEFLANMSHELRTPLNSILVLSQILGSNKNGNLSEKQIQSAKTIYSSGNSLLSIINEVLDLSKVESGKLEISMEDMPVKELLTQMKETFLPLAKEKGIDFKTSVVPDFGKTIRTDSLRLTQIIRNLCANAIKFTTQGHVEIKVSYPGNDAHFYNGRLNSENAIAICVNDTGIGIPKEKQELIFEAFRQADGTTTRKYGGTGLGLTISRKFAELLGGEIHVESEENKGTTFTLFLPREGTQESKNTVLNQSETVKTQAEVADLPPRQVEKIKVPDKKPDPIETVHISDDPTSKDDRKNIARGDKFILVIEDDASFSQILYDLAHEKGFKCMIAPNGETGLHYADYYKPDAIILDIGLPGIDGWEVMDRLKEKPETRHIPVHFMSGHDKSLEAMKKGAIGFMKKPVGVDEIDTAFDHIENIISKPLKKVLIVEDDDALRESVRELVEDKDVVVTSTASGGEALELLKKQSFDCMILDLGLRDMTGFDLMKKLGKNGKSSQMPIIIYTGKELSHEEEESLQKYSDRIIIKGVRSPERLLAETTLFLHRVEKDLPPDKQKMLKSVNGREDVIRDKKILIVDDDMRNVFALTNLLEDRGARVEVGRNGKEGLEKLGSIKDIDLVLMDIMMPEMNGYEAMEQIRSKKKFKELPIIALTAKAMQGDREKCINAGANDYMTKPIDPDKLVSLLRVWLYK